MRTRRRDERVGFQKHLSMKTRSLHQFGVAVRGAGCTRPIHQSPGWGILSWMQAVADLECILFVRRGHVLVANHSHLIMFGGKA